MTLKGNICKVEAFAKWIKLGIVFALIGGTAQSDRACYVCSGEDCMQNPYNPSLSPGRITCHPVDDYCVTHIQYLVKNESLESGKPLGPEDYVADSATRSCAKTYLGNLCRRDFLGKPHITCISTCDTNYCNCHSRSPPPEMFVDGKTQYESPKKSTYSSNDVLSCIAVEEAKAAEEKELRERQVTETTRPRGPRRPGRPKSRSRQNARSAASAPSIASFPVYSLYFILLLLVGIYLYFPACVISSKLHVQC